MSIKRYNQGFSKFGPLEQCHDGKWMKYEDFKDTKKSLKELFALSVSLNQDKDDLTNELNSTRIIALVSSGLLVLESVYFLIKSILEV